MRLLPCLDQSTHPRERAICSILPMPTALCVLSEADRPSLDAPGHAPRNDTDEGGEREAQREDLQSDLLLARSLLLRAEAEVK